MAGDRHNKAWPLLALAALALLAALVTQSPTVFAVVLAAGIAPYLATSPELRGRHQSADDPAAEATPQAQEVEVAPSPAKDADKSEPEAEAAPVKAPEA